MDQSDEFWWRNGIFYQIYPRSFQDTNADGVGDIAGIIERLPYLEALGVDAVWLSPIFPSPMADFGYDISDYTGIDPLFGTMEDFDALVSAAHDRGLKLILDLVPNHTSDQHPWFIESRASRDNPKRDWYIWRDPAADGGPPNNWLSEFGGSAWEFDAETGQYYYHAFLSQQPDLNWRNPAVREAIYDVMRFWLRRGVDGFRVDVIWHLIKDAEFRDNPPNPHFRDGRPPHEQISDALLDRSARSARRHRGDAARGRRVRRSRADRRDLSAAGPSGGLLRQRSRGRASAVQLRAVVDAVERAFDREDHRAITSARCRPAHGRTGCSAITTVRGSQAASGRSRRGSPRCCC